MDREPHLYVWSMISLESLYVETEIAGTDYRAVVSVMPTHDKP